MTTNLLTDLFGTQAQLTTEGLLTVDLASLKDEQGNDLFPSFAANSPIGFRQIVAGLIYHFSQQCQYAKDDNGSPIIDKTNGVIHDPETVNLDFDERGGEKQIKRTITFDIYSTDTTVFKVENVIF